MQLISSVCFSVDESFLENKDTRGMTIFCTDIHPDSSRLAVAGRTVDASGIVMILCMTPLSNPEFSCKLKGSAKILSELNHHQKTVNACKWSRNGLYLATCGDDRTVNIFAHRTNGDKAASYAAAFEENWQTRWTLTGHDADVLDVKWGLDDSVVVSCGVDNTIIVWDAEKGSRIARLRDHSSLVKSVEFDPSGKYMASISDDKSIRIWNTGDWSLDKVVKEAFFNAETCIVNRITWLADGSAVVAGSAVAAKVADAGVKFVPALVFINRSDWKAEQKAYGFNHKVYLSKANPRLFVHKNKVSTIFATVYSNGRNSSCIQVWRKQSFRPFGAFRNIPGTISDLSWTPDGSALLASTFTGLFLLLKFSAEELGSPPLSRTDHASLINRYYGSFGGVKKINLNDSLMIDALKPNHSKLANGAENSSEKIDLPYKDIPLDKQKEVVLPSGRRRITPMFVVHNAKASSKVEPVKLLESVNEEKPREAEIKNINDLVIPQHWSNIEAFLRNNELHPESKKKKLKTGEKKKSKGQVLSDLGERSAISPTSVSSSGSSSASNVPGVSKSEARKLEVDNFAIKERLTEVEDYLNALKSKDAEPKSPAKADGKNRPLSSLQKSEEVQLLPDEDIPVVPTQETFVKEIVAFSDKIELLAACGEASYTVSIAKSGLTVCVKQENLDEGSRKNETECRTVVSVTKTENGTLAWSEVWPFQVACLKASSKYLAVGSTEGDVYAFSMRNGDLIVGPLIAMNSFGNVHKLLLRKDILAAIWTSADIMTYNLVEKRMEVQTSAKAAVGRAVRKADRNASLTADLQIYNENICLCIKSPPMSFIYNPSSNVWMRQVVPYSFTYDNSPQNPIAPSSKSNVPLANLCGFTDMAHIDKVVRDDAFYLISLRNAQVLKSSVEVRKTLRAYISYLAQNGAQRRIRRYLNLFVNGEDGWEDDTLARDADSLAVFLEENAINKAEWLKELLHPLQSKPEFQNMVARYVKYIA